MARESYRVLLKKSGRRWKVHSARVAKAGAHGRERPTEADRTGLGRVEVVAHDSDEVLSGHSLELDAYQEVFSPDGSVSLEPRRAAVDGFWTRLLQTEPFDALAANILGVRMDVISPVSGVSVALDADERTQQETYEAIVASGLAVPPDADLDTPFKATLAWPRLIVVDTAAAQAFVAEHVETAANSVVVVVANTGLYGGSGAEHVPVFSLSGMSADIAVHELGHAAFGLADEYAWDAPGRDQPLTEPNVADDCRLGALKWAHLVNVAETDLGVDHAITGPGPHIGAFLGAKYRTAGAYRPEFDCRMRTVNQPFCAVCREAIGKVLG
jgi:hypothetical protein